jgi:hypothetical protein
MICSLMFVFKYSIVYAVERLESNAKCSHLKKLTCEGTLLQVFFCMRPPPYLGFCLGWSSNFVGSESGQIESVKLLQNMVSNRTQHPPPLTATVHTVCIYCTLTQGGGGGEPERRLEGQ